MTQKEYDIEISNVNFSPLHKYILAATFDEAYQKAQKILAEYQTDIPDAEITKIECECEITEA